MVKISDITKCLMAEIKALCPNAFNCVGKMPEKHMLPCFVYYIIFNSVGDENFFTTNNKLDFQIVYFGKYDGYDNESEFEKQSVMELLNLFFGRGNIQVGDRNLKFRTRMANTDDNISYILSFDYLDDKNNLKYEEEQRRPKIEDIFTNKEEII